MCKIVNFKYFDEDLTINIDQSMHLSCICILKLLTLSFQPIDYNGFTLFMKTYLELNEVPEELCKSLFQSFMKTGKCCNIGNSHSTDVASQTICVPLAHSSTDLLNHVGTDRADRYHGLLAEKFHDLTERIHSLGHSSGEKLYQHRKREHQHFETINSVGILCSKTGILPLSSLGCHRNYFFIACYFHKFVVCTNYGGFARNFLWVVLNKPRLAGLQTEWRDVKVIFWE